MKSSLLIVLFGLHFIAFAGEISVPAAAPRAATEAEATARLKGPPIKLQFENMPLGAVISALMHGSGVNFRLEDPKTFSERVTVSVENDRWTLLRTLADDYAVEMHWHEGAWLLKRDSIATERLKVVYVLKNVPPELAKKKAADLGEALHAFAKDEGKPIVSYDTAKGALEVVAGPRGHSQARDFVRSIDVAQTKVRIEITIISGSSLPNTEPILSAEEFQRVLKEVRGKAKVSSTTETYVGQGHKRIALPHNSFCELFVRPFNGSRKIGMTFSAEVRGADQDPVRTFVPDPRAAPPLRPASKASLTSQPPKQDKPSGVTLEDGHTTIAKNGDVLLAVTAKFVDAAK